MVDPESPRCGIVLEECEGIVSDSLQACISQVALGSGVDGNSSYFQLPPTKGGNRRLLPPPPSEGGLGRLRKEVLGGPRSLEILGSRIVLLES